MKALVDSIANLSRGFRQIRCRIVKDRPSPCLLVIWAHYVSAMTILTVRGGPVRSGPVQKTARMRGGRWNPHRATQKQRGLHRSRLTPTAQCICRGAGPSAALWQTHEPDDTPAKGRLPTSEPLIKCRVVDSLRLFQLALSTPRPGPLGRLAWQPVTAGRSSRFAGMTPDVPGSGRGQWSTLDLGERT